MSARRPCLAPAGRAPPQATGRFRAVHEAIAFLGKTASVRPTRGLALLLLLLLAAATGRCRRHRRESCGVGCDRFCVSEL